MTVDFAEVLLLSGQKSPLPRFKCDAEKQNAVPERDDETRPEDPFRQTEASERQCDRAADGRGRRESAGAQEREHGHRSERRNEGVEGESTLHHKAFLQKK